MIEKPTIEITVNGEAYQLADGSTVIDLVDALKLASERLAIELNLSILPRAEWSETRLKDGDKIEIVHFVGGGSIADCGESNPKRDKKPKSARKILDAGC